MGTESASSTSRLAEARFSGGTVPPRAVGAGVAARGAGVAGAGVGEDRSSVPVLALGVPRTVPSSGQTFVDAGNCRWQLGQVTME